MRILLLFLGLAACQPKPSLAEEASQRMRDRCERLEKAVPSFDKEACLRRVL